MRKILLALLCCMSWLFLDAEVVIKGTNDGKYYLADGATGEQLSEKTYSYISPINNRKNFSGKINNLWAILDGATGKELTEPEFSNIGFFQEGLAIVDKNNLKGYIDQYGTIVIPIEYSEAGYFSNGIAPVKKGAKRGFIDLQGNWYDTKPAASQVKTKKYTPTIADDAKAVANSAKETFGSIKGLFGGKKSSKKNNRKDKAAAQSNQTSNTSSKQNAASNSFSSKSKPNAVAESEEEGVPYVPDLNHPYITKNTFYMKLDQVNDYTISNVSDGIFAIKQGNLMSFWHVDGYCLYGYDWTTSQAGLDYGQFPQFTDGACIARSAKPNKAGRGYFAILYKDGSVKELDPNWTEVSQFMNGLALVTQQLNGRTTYFYINLRGQKVFPTLKIDGGYDTMRPLGDGLRAFRSSNSNWGYIDQNGNIAIQPKYKGAGTFRNGYAWVYDNATRTAILINTKGEKIYDSEVNATSLYNNANFGYVDNGRFHVARGSYMHYYDLTGKELAKCKSGNGFYNGHAFVKYEDGIWGTETFMVNTDFKKITTIDENILPAFQLEYINPRFGDYELASYTSGTRSIALTPEGGVALEGWIKKADETGDKIPYFGTFGKDGYAVLREVRIKNIDYVGIVRASGEIAWLFSVKKPTFFIGFPIPPTPPETPEKPEPPIINDPEPPQPRVPEDTIPRGPKKRIPTTYSIKLNVTGEGTAKAVPSNQLQYGDCATLTAKPAEGWVLADISGGYSDGSQITVTSDKTIDIVFRKREEVRKIPFTGAYQGVKRVEFLKATTEDMTIYGEISREPTVSSPYGENTYGYLVGMIDPKKKYSNDEVSCYAFFAPMRVSGYQIDEASGKEYMLIDGGVMTVGNITVKNGNAIGSLMSNLMFAFDGYSTVQIIPRSYRVEILDRNDETGEFTFGRLEAFSVKYGWLPGGDKRLTIAEKGLFSFKLDHGFKADAFDGTRMKIAEPRNDVIWYPPMEWYKNNEPAHHDAAEKMGEMYRFMVPDLERIFGKIIPQ